MQDGPGPHQVSRAEGGTLTPNSPLVPEPCRAGPVSLANPSPPPSPLPPFPAALPPTSKSPLWAPGVVVPGRTRAPRVQTPALPPPVCKPPRPCAAVRVNPAMHAPQDTVLLVSLIAGGPCVRGGPGVGLRARRGPGALDEIGGGRAVAGSLHASVGSSSLPGPFPTPARP